MEREGAQRAAGCLLFLAAVVAGLGYLFRDELRRYRLQAAFPEADLRRLAAAAKLRPGEESVGPGETPWRRGKVVLIVPSVTTKDFGDSILTDTEVQPPLLQDDMARLPDPVRARDASEVGTVIMCSPEKRPDGARWVLLRVFDVQKQILVGEGAVDGTFPQRQLQKGDSEVGPVADVAGFVARMPAR